MDDRTEEEKERDWRQDISDDCKMEAKALSEPKKKERKLLCAGFRINGVQKVKIGDIKI